MKLPLTCILIVAVISCKPADHKVRVASSNVGDRQGTVDSVFQAPEPVTIDFKLKYSATLPAEYVGWPEPGEDENCPAIFSIGDGLLSVHSPVYELDAPNYFTYGTEDSLTYKSARKAHEIDDYWYHLQIDVDVFGTATGWPQSSV